MAQPTQTDVHVDQILTNMSVAYIQNASMFVATKVFPVVTVQKQSDKYYTYPKGAWFRDEAEVRADGTEASGSGYGQSTDNYSCDVYAHKKDIGDQVRANADAPLSPDLDAVTFVSQRLMLRQEVQWVTDTFATGKWGTDASFTTPTQWSTYTSSDPITDIETGKTTILKNTGFLPNKLVLGYEVYTKLKHHPDIVDRISGGATAANPALGSDALLARIFGVDEVIIPMAIKNTGKEGEADSFGFTHGKHALLCYTTSTPGLLSPTAGYTFQWQGVSQGLGTEVGIKKFRMEALASDRVEGQIAFDNKIVSTDLGYFFNSVVA